MDFQGLTSGMGRQQEAGNVDPRVGVTESGGQNQPIANLAQPPDTFQRSVPAGSDAAPAPSGQIPQVPDEVTRQVHQAANHFSEAASVEEGENNYLAEVAKALSVPPQG